jgi:hypothetical protein
MSRSLTKQQLCAALEEAGVKYPLSATVIESRVLYEQISAANDVSSLVAHVHQNNHVLPSEHPAENEVMSASATNVQEAARCS